MANETRQILIDNILGGESDLANFASSGEFQTSVGIDPSLPIGDIGDNFREVSANSVVASGLLRPVAVVNVNNTLNGVPLWSISHPKWIGETYVYTNTGSVYTYDFLTKGTTELSDGDSMVGSSGNGGAYYDNYIYLSKDTTIARYGPLNGTPSFDGNYWSGTLGLTALNDGPNLPFGPGVPNQVGVPLPNHILHRHSDGRLYIADVVDNKGTIHYIETSKTSVEGDTDAGSTYSKLELGYGLWITAIETYGSNLAIALFEGNRDNESFGYSKAKIAFWDTNSQNINSIIWVEFPDSVISSLKNVNGVLYVTSSSANFNDSRFRLSRFVGGYTLEEVFYKDAGRASYPGAMYGVGDHLLFGGTTFSPEEAGCVFSYGLRKANIGRGFFTPIRITQGTSYVPTALAPSHNPDNPVILWGDMVNQNAGGIDVIVPGFNIVGTDYSQSNQVWWSKKFNLAGNFKITKIRIPFAQPIAENMIVTAKIYTDDGNGTTYTLTEINNTNYSGKKKVIFRSDANGGDITGENNFWIELKWTGSALCTVSLPISIQYELIDD